MIRTVTRRLAAAPSAVALSPTGCDEPAPARSIRSAAIPSATRASATAWARRRLKAMASSSVPTGIAM
jgi:hypothetical protein